MRSTHTLIVHHANDSAAAAAISERLNLKDSIFSSLVSIADPSLPPPHYEIPKFNVIPEAITLIIHDPSIFPNEMHSIFDDIYNPLLPNTPRVLIATSCEPSVIKSFFNNFSIPCPQIVSIDEPITNGSIDRLSAGIRGLPPRRRLSTTLDSSSLFATSKTKSLFIKHSNLARFSYLIEPSRPLSANADVLNVVMPDEPVSHIKTRLQAALSRVYDEKYADRSTDQDERYLNFEAWNDEFSRLIDRVLWRPAEDLNAVVVGIGNECPSKYGEFRSISAVDISRLSLDKAKKRLPFIEMICDSADNLTSFSSNMFDIYISLRTFQSSFFDIVQSALEAARILRTHSIAVISVPHLYVSDKMLASGLQINDEPLLDQNKPWETSSVIRQAFEFAGFSCELQTGFCEIYVIAYRTGDTNSSS